jgi:hypothetical protein
VSQGQRYFRPEGVGVFPLNYAARERTVLEVQGKRDRRHIPPVWFWRLLRDDEEAGGEGLSEEYFEQPLIDRRYAPAQAAHLFVNDSAETKGMNRGKVETEGTVEIEMSRAECLRLGVVYQIASDVDGRIEEARPEDDPFAPGDLLYVPQPGDLFMYKAVHFIVHQMADQDHFGPTEIPSVWKGHASQLKDDATSPIFGTRADLVPPSSVPPQPVGIGEIRWPG